VHLLQLGWPIVDADDYHPPANKQKMIEGIPLTDEASIASELFSICQFICKCGSGKFFFVCGRFQQSLHRWTV